MAKVTCYMPDELYARMAEELDPEVNLSRILQRGVIAVLGPPRRPAVAAVAAAAPT